METKQVRAGRDTILGYVERASPVDILAELIWNALDAEAMNIETTVAIGAMGAPEEIVVRDDGHGMPHDQVPDLFLTHGESWKRTSGFSPNINRPMHGQLGRGRFLVYGIAEHVEWRSVSVNDDVLTETVIHGSRGAPNEFTFDGPWPSTGSTGTTVHMETRQTSRVASIADGEVSLPLTARLAASLLALPEVKVRYRGQRLSPQSHITQDVDLDLDLDPATLYGKSRPRLRVVEWSADMRSKTLYLCDERGGVVTEHKLGRMPPAPIQWTAYLQWEGFRDPNLMGPADLHVPDIRHGELLAVAQRALVDYLNRRLDEEKGSILAEWKAEGVYPYQGEPRSAAEEVEREIFDIVAVVASPAIGRDVKQKKLSLRQSGLTRVVRTLITQRDDVEFASNPVTLPSGKRGRVDMVFSRHLPESERTRHLVVELKRPMRLTMTEFGQINNYASAITDHPEVLGTPHDWEFWLVGTEIDDVVRNQYSDPARPGLTTNNPRYRIWVMTWGQLLDQAERRVQAFRSALELVSTDQTSRDYLQRKHAEFIPPLTASRGA